MQNLNQKQAFLFTIINYVGILIGVISTLFIYPKNKEVLGIFRYVEALAQLFYPLLLIGGSQALINFSPTLSDTFKKKLFNYNVLSILLLSGLGFVLIVVLSLIPALKGMKYVYFSFTIAICLALIELFKKQVTIIQKIAIPTFLDNIIPKLTLPLLFSMVLFSICTLQQSLLFFVGSSLLVLVLFALYLKSQWQPTMDFDFKELINKMGLKNYYKFSFFAFVGSLGSVFAFRLDALLIPKLLNMEALGTFSIGVTLASALAIPATGIFILYAPIVSNHLKNNNLTILNREYKAVAKFLFFIGMLLYSCVFLGIENLFSLLPTAKNLLPSVPIILILGFNVVVNMGTGFNGEIITYSKFYKFNLIAILLLALLNIILIITFVKVFNGGIQSIAIASLIAIVIFNVVKLLFIYKKFRLWPFDNSYLKLIAVFSVVLTVIYFMPTLQNHFLNLIYKCGLCALINLVIIYKLQLVYQYHSKVNMLFNKLLSDK